VKGSVDVDKGVALLNVVEADIVVIDWLLILKDVMVRSNWDILNVLLMSWDMLNGLLNGLKAESMIYIQTELVHVTMICIITDITLALNVCSWAWLNIHSCAELNVLSCAAKNALHCAECLKNVPNCDELNVHDWSMYSIALRWTYMVALSGWWMYSIALRWTYTFALIKFSWIKAAECRHMPLHAHACGLSRVFTIFNQLREWTSQFKEVGYGLCEWTVRSRTVGLRELTRYSVEEAHLWMD
jgi:hypothetical protein